MNLMSHRLRWSLLLVLVVLIVFATLGSRYISQVSGVAADANHYLDLPLFQIGQQPVSLLFLIRVAIFLIVLVLISHFAMRFLKNRILNHTPLSHSQQYALARVISYLVFAFGLIVGLESIGLNLNSLVVIGGALGIGIGLGLQPIVTNFVAGLILLLEQPVRLGDRIEIGDTYGDVVRMKGRSTWVRTNDNVVIIVPNSEFINNRVTNWTANDPHVRISLPVGVSYNADPEKVRNILLEIANKHPDVLHDMPPQVIFTEFGDSSLNFELRVWTTRQVQTPKVLKSDLYFSVFAAFREHGIEIPFPQRDLHVRSVATTIPSLFGMGSVKNLESSGTNAEI
jgi:small-conductance mechanosensitive channel